MKKTSILLALVGLLAMACQSAKQQTPKALYGTWKVAYFRFKDGKVMPGALMGYPQYEFTKEGKRIKNLNEEPAPPPEVVTYAVRNDSIFYPEHPKLPAVKIAKLTQDSLVLDSEKLTWHLYKGA